jgi:hypothetical protein
MPRSFRTTILIIDNICLNKTMSKPIRNNYLSRTVWRNEQGQVHRIDGPAVEYDNGTKMWYYNNTYHRLDGPAIVRFGQAEYGQWFIFGKEIILH